MDIPSAGTGAFGKLTLQPTWVFAGEGGLCMSWSRMDTHVHCCGARSQATILVMSYRRWEKNDAGKIRVWSSCWFEFVTVEFECRIYERAATCWPRASLVHSISKSELMVG